MFSPQPGSSLSVGIHQPFREEVLWLGFCWAYFPFLTVSSSGVLEVHVSASTPYPNTRFDWVLRQALCQVLGIHGLIQAEPQARGRCCYHPHFKDEAALTQSFLSEQEGHLSRSIICQHRPCCHSSASDRSSEGEGPAHSLMAGKWQT